MHADKQVHEAARLIMKLGCAKQDMKRRGKLEKKKKGGRGLRRKSVTVGDMPSSSTRQKHALGRQHSRK